MKHFRFLAIVSHRRLSASPPPAMASAVASGGKRELKAQEAQADALIQSFGQAAQMAVEREIEFVVAALRGSTNLLYALSGLIKDEGITALLDGRLTGERKDVDADKLKQRKLRQSLKRFKHLDSA